jgi:hypothetical protein
MTKFLVSADHLSPKYRLDNMAFHVDGDARVAEVEGAGRVGYYDGRRHGYAEEFYADLHPFGCGKSFATAEAAIRSLLQDNGCTNIRITRA